MRAAARFQDPAVRRKAGGIAVLLGLVLLLLHGGLTAAAAEQPMPEGPKTLIVHPAAAHGQPETPGTGLPVEGEAASSPQGHTFDVRLVPGFDVRNSAEWNAAGRLTPEEAERLVAGQPARTGERPGDGTTVFRGLETGLYLVTEVGSPAGVLPSAPFLVALPLQHPTQENAWLTTVHVYPKHGLVDVALAVYDAEHRTEEAPVRWASESAIPGGPALSRYRVEQLLADGLRLAGPVASVEVTIVGGAPLAEGADYRLASLRGSGRPAPTGTNAAGVASRVAGLVRPFQVADRRNGFVVEFTSQGLAKLAEHEGGRVRVGYATHLPGAGEFTNEVRLLAGNAGVVSATATTKFGPLLLRVHERGHPQHRITGVEFRLYASEADARAQRDPIAVDGAPALRTGGDGEAMVPALRFSAFANGLDREPGSPLARDYYARVSSYPPGWTGEDVILRGSVASATEPATLTAVVWRDGDGEQALTTTGARVLASALLGGVLVVAGTLVIARRKRQGSEAAR